jgi:hypothetical protein
VVLVLVSKLKLIEVEFLSTGVVYRSDRDFPVVAFWAGALPSQSPPFELVGDSGIFFGGASSPMFLFCRKILLLGGRAVGLLSCFWM